MHTISVRPPNPAHPYSFQGALRAHVTEPLVEIQKTDGDRVVDFLFGVSRLHVRLTGRTGGIWLVVGEKVLASLDGPAENVPSLDPDTGRPSRAPRFVPGNLGTWNTAAEDWFARAESDHATAERRRRVTANLRTRVAREQRLLAALERDLARAEQVTEARSRADTFVAHLHDVPPGAQAFEASDVSDPLIVHRYLLDPRKSPGKFLNTLYDRVRRMERMADRVLNQMEEVESRIKQFADAIHAVDAASEDELARLERLSPPVTAKSHDGQGQYWTWHGPRGEVALVGKNAQGNRQVTFQLARASDTWMHARDVPGPHVVVKIPNKRTPPLETLLAAAQIALMGTRTAEGSVADVQYTTANKVRAVKGGSPGTVVVHDERVLRVTRGLGYLAGWVREGAPDPYP
jgi:predicted ribosome quality control (RQC) complex YloA/Tae2 family protein